MGFIALLSGDGGDTGRRGATATGEARHGATSTSGAPLVNVASRKRRHGPSSDRALRSATVLLPARRLPGGYGGGATRRRRARRCSSTQCRAEALDVLDALKAAGRLMVLPPAQLRPNGYREALRRQGRRGATAPGDVMLVNAARGDVAFALEGPGAVQCD